MNHEVRWTAKKVAQRISRIEPLVYRRVLELAPFRYKALNNPSDDPPIGDHTNDTYWSLIDPNTFWGRLRTNFVLRTSFQIPSEWATGLPLALYLPIGEAGDFSHPEALIYIDGKPYAACDRYHQEISLNPQWQDGEPHLLALHGWTGLGQGWYRGEFDGRLYMRGCAVVQIDEPTQRFLNTATIALGVANTLAESEPAKVRLLNALNETFTILDTREPYGERFYASVSEALKALQTGISKAGHPLDVDIVAAGHAHLDIAWLWTLDQARRKAGRTFHTVLHLMDQVPEFHFTQSQPQLYEFIRQDYPALFEDIKQRVIEGRWEPVGGMWVEADCNLSGPEALVRQLLLGRDFFQQHFPDAESPILWLPDCFGYPWTLPQLMKQAGLDYFFSIKLGWNQYNRLPYDSFWWQGLDGSRVLAHFSTTPDNFSPGGAISTYSARATPKEVIGTWTNFQQKEFQKTLLMSFGHGDGGGGPTRRMIDGIKIMHSFPATPRTRFGRVFDFYKKMENEAGEYLPTWNGELYVEGHRGTYTTHGAIKRANRQAESSLHDAEFLATLATLVNADYGYPFRKLSKAWKSACLNQHHDIITGTAINPVIVEALQHYADIQDICSDVRDEALDIITRRLSGDLLIVNPTGFSQNELVFWPDRLIAGVSLQRADGTPLSLQTTDNGTWIDTGDLAPFSVLSIHVTEGDYSAPESHLTVTPTQLENDYLRVTFDACGDIIGIYDKVHEREVIPPGTIANQYQAFEDYPLRVGLEAWDLEIFYDDKMWTADPASSVRVAESGPLRGSLELQRQILGSKFTQRVSLNHNKQRLDFETSIAWQERHILLKVAFPVDILSPTATYDVQWGNVERPTHRNTSWDWARFEMCAQKWVDLSEGDYGVSLLNYGKYGHDVMDNVMRLSVLRGSTSPDPDADLGNHRFTYSLLPHSGHWNETTIAAAYVMNDPLIVTAGHKKAESGAVFDINKTYSDLSQSMISSANSNVVIETVKMAEDGNGIIVRIYESQRMRGYVNLTTGFALGAVWKTNLLEENHTQLQQFNNCINLYVLPYEIVTLRLVPAEE